MGSLGAPFCKTWEFVRHHENCKNNEIKTCTMCVGPLIAPTG